MRIVIQVFLNIIIVAFGIYKLFIEYRKEGNYQETALKVAIFLVVLTGLNAIFNLIVTELSKKKSDKSKKQERAEFQEFRNEIKQKLDEIKKANPQLANLSWPEIKSLLSPKKRELLEQAFTYLKEYKYQDAISSFRECMALETDDKEKADLIIYIGNIFCAQSKFDEALGTYKEAFELSQRIRYDAGKANALGNLGLVYQDRGDLEQALKHHQQALEIHRKIDNPLGVAGDLNNLGIVYKDRGDLEQALMHYQQALEIHRRIGNPLGEANTLVNLGIVYEEKRDLEEALKHYQQALMIFTNVGNPLGEANALGNLGGFYEFKGNFDEALSYYQQALAIFEKIGARLQIEITRKNIKHIELSMGKTGTRN